MTEFHRQEFSTRFAKLGDQAEAAFLSVYPKAHRTGLDRPSFSMKGMPSRLRNIPDFLLPDGFVEVMGFSSRGNGTLKLKLEKADALKAWDLIGPVNLFVYDSGGKKYYQAPIRDWLDACYLHADREAFDDNGALYWNLHHRHFPVAASDMLAAAA